MSNSTRAVFGGGETPSLSNVMDKITIASTGNSTDFGDLIAALKYVSGNGTGHGGLS